MFFITICSDCSVRHIKSRKPKENEHSYKYIDFAHKIYIWLSNCLVDKGKQTCL